LFDFLKKKAPEPLVPVAPVMAPPPSLLQQVQQLQAEGRTDAEIVQYMQAQGMPPQQIYDALAQNVASQGPEPVAPADHDIFGPEPKPEPKVDEPSTEELIESIVDERWKKLKVELKKLEDWKSSQSTKVDKLEQGLSDVQSSVESLHKAIVGKLSEYDKSLLDVGTEIKAMEKVFQKVLPELTSSVQTLSGMAKKKRP